MDEERRQERTARENARLAAFVVIVVLLVAFVLDNRHRVRVGYVVGDAEVRLIWVLVITALVGAAAGWLLRWLRTRR